MSGWRGAGDFKSRMGGKSEFVPCMFKMAGISECPHCKRADEFFKNDEEQLGRRAYFKKAIYGYSKVVKAPPSAQEKDGKIVLMNFPVRITDFILKKVQDIDEDTRWPTPTDLDAGNILVLSKDKGDEYSQYGVDITDRTMPIEPEKWERLQGRLVNLDNPVELMRAVRGMDEKFRFSPTNDMKDGERLRFRLLPNVKNVDAVPFAVMFGHYVQALTPWDKAWAEVNYDPARYKEVMEMLGEDVGAGPEDTNDDDMGF